MINLLKQDRVDTDCIIVSKERHTTVKTRIIAEQHQIVRMDREKRNAIDYEVAKYI